MTEPEPSDAALERMLRLGAPRPLADQGFVARAMAAVDDAARGSPTSRQARVAPVAIARALAAEQRRHAEQARLWRWATAGIIAGALLLGIATMAAPAGSAADMAGLRQCASLWTLLAAGSLWYAWHAWRSN